MHHSTNKTAAFQDLIQTEVSGLQFSAFLTALNVWRKNHFYNYKSRKPTFVTSQDHGKVTMYFSSEEYETPQDPVYENHRHWDAMQGTVVISENGDVQISIDCGEERPANLIRSRTHEMQSVLTLQICDRTSLRDQKAICTEISRFHGKYGTWKRWAKDLIEAFEIKEIEVKPYENTLSSSEFISELLEK